MLIEREQRGQLPLGRFARRNQPRDRFAQECLRRDRVLARQGTAEFLLGAPAGRRGRCASFEFRRSRFHGKPRRSDRCRPPWRAVSTSHATTPAGCMFRAPTSARTPVREQTMAGRDVRNPSATHGQAARRGDECRGRARQRSIVDSGANAPCAAAGRRRRAACPGTSRGRVDWIGARHAKEFDGWQEMLPTHRVRGRPLSVMARPSGVASYRCPSARRRGSDRRSLEVQPLSIEREWLPDFRSGSRMVSAASSAAHGRRSKAATRPEHVTALRATPHGTRRAGQRFPCLWVRKPRPAGSRAKRAPTSSERRSHRRPTGRCPVPPPAGQ